MRTGDGSRELAVGEVVACPTGLGGAHRVENTSGEPARVLIINRRGSPAISSSSPLDVRELELEWEAEVLSSILCDGFHRSP